jgi:cyanobactin maturation PatA/PatG family protease
LVLEIFLYHIQMSSIAEVFALSELKHFWEQSVGNPQICIAILDSVIDRSHPCLEDADLSHVQTLYSNDCIYKGASSHGTQVASIIFGQHCGPLKGVAPYCRGVSIPLFSLNNSSGSVSQLDLARAIYQAAEIGAHVINISGGQLTESCKVDPILTRAVKFCVDNQILIVASVGNDGLPSHHIPAALPDVLAVGAMDSQGNPIAFSNWGEKYQIQGILAPGENIPVAELGGGISSSSGTSFATAIVSGIVGLLLSIQLKHGQKPNPNMIRASILRTAFPCKQDLDVDCSRFLAGRLNISGAYAHIAQGGVQLMSESETEIQKQSPSEGDNQNIDGIEVGAYSKSAETAYPNKMHTESFMPSQSADPCNCSKCSSVGRDPLVYALGKLNYEFGSEARRDSFTQAMHLGRDNPNDPRQLLTCLEENPWAASSIVWTLNLDATPVYAINPSGSFSDVAYDRLRSFLNQQINEGVEIVSIPGTLNGRTTKLLSGQVVPDILPEIRGMYSWSATELVQAVLGQKPTEDAMLLQYNQRAEGVNNFLERIYYELRNLGITPQDRAINYAATNAFQVSQVFQQAINEHMELDSIEIEKSPICRLDSECFDVKLQFFDPERHFQRARKVYRFTIDVSDVIPVTVGTVRSWSIY